MSKYAYRDKETRNSLKIKYLLNATPEGAAVANSIFSEIRKSRKEAKKPVKTLSQYDTIKAVEEK